MSAESLDVLKELDYPVKITFDREDGVYTAEYLDLPGCSAYGDTVEEAYRLAEEAKEDWLKVTMEQGLPIPRPAKPEDHSGRILLRVPSGLHALLSDQAKLHGVSLNQFIVHLLSAGVVGDSLSGQVQHLSEQISQLQWRMAQMGSTVKISQSQTVPTTAIANTADVSGAMANFVMGGSVYLDRQSALVNYGSQYVVHQGSYTGAEVLVSSGALFLDDDAIGPLRVATTSGQISVKPNPHRKQTTRAK